MLLSVFEKLGIDKHIFYTLVYRLWNILAGAVVVFLVPIFFSKNIQGYYFTFASLIASQVFFELGLNFVITQIVAHESAGIKLLQFGMLDGSLNNKERLLSLLQLVRKWYCILSFSFLLILISAGILFFTNNNYLAFSIWGIPWCLHVLFTSINIFLSPYYAISEGLGLVADIAKVRIIQSIIGYILFSVAIVCGLQLFAVVFVSGSAAFIGMYWLLRHRWAWIFSLSHELSNTISWRKEIFPFQWRIALSWISGYFIFQIFTPIIFAHQGAEEAGKIGLTMSIFSTLSSFSMSWVSAKNNIFGRLISKNSRSELNIVFFKTLIQSSIFNAIVLLLFTSFLFFIQKFDITELNKLSERLASFNVVLLLAVVSVFNHLVYCFAAYIRAHKTEPMMYCSLVVAFLTTCSVYMASFYSVFYTMLSYCIICVFISFPWAYFLYLKYRNSEMF